MTDSVRVGYQGASGAFSEEALLASAVTATEPIGFPSAGEVGRAIANREVRFGFLPLENTIAGTVAASYDVLHDPALRVTGEVVMPIVHCLLGMPGAPVAGLRRVLSHPVALAQCHRFLGTHPRIRPEAVFDTAGAAALVADAGDPTVAAIAPRACADRYGLQVLADGVQDTPDNRTRFAVIADERDTEVDLLAAGPTTRVLILATMLHAPGSLARLLSAAAAAGHNMTKIEGRPGSEPWTYRFFVEFEQADAFDEEVIRARAGVDLRVVGRYPRLRLPRPPAPSPQLTRG